MTQSLPIPITAPLTRAQQSTLINLVRRAARAEILPRFRTLGLADARTKTGRFDLVTEADTGAEAILTRGILQMFPHALVVGEEAASAGFRHLIFMLQPGCELEQVEALAKDVIPRADGL